MIFRRVYDVQTGEHTRVDQTIYKNKDGDLLVLDSIEPTPEGFEAITEEDFKNLKQ